MPSTRGLAMKRTAIALTLVFLMSSSTLGASRAWGKSSSPAKALTVVAVGDIACDPASPDFHGGQGDNKFCQQTATSDLAAQANADAVLVLGDNQYENGSLAAFQQSYDPSWGRFKAITYPVPGNHEYQTAGAAGYFSFFGTLARNTTGGY